MTEEQIIYLVFWDSPLTQTYLYGTTLRRTKSGVEFINNLMPSGQIIHSWDSEIDYQPTRSHALLPVLEEGKIYHLVPFIEAEPAHSIAVQITFFDRHDQQIGFQVVHSDGSFTYPEDTYRYRIDIVQAGAESFLFHHLEIFQDGMTDSTPVLHNQDLLDPRIHIYLPEFSNTRMIRIPEEESLYFLTNLVFAPTTAAVPSPFFRDGFLKQIPKNNKKLIFVSTGASSLRAAEWLQAHYPGSAILAAESLPALIDQKYQLRESK